MGSVKVDIDLGGVRSKFSQSNLDMGQLNMANRALETMNERTVPMDTQHLADTGHVANNGKQIIWQTPYGKAQYYGTNGIATFSNYTKPGTGPRWDEAAKSMFMSDWLRAFTKGAGF